MYVQELVKVERLYCIRVHVYSQVTDYSHVTVKLLTHLHIHHAILESHKVCHSMLLYYSPKTSTPHSTGVRSQEVSAPLVVPLTRKTEVEQVETVSQMETETE